MEPAREGDANDGRGDCMNLEERLAKAFKPLFDAFPQGIIQEVDSVSDVHATIYVHAPDGTGETWLIQFRPGSPLEMTRIG